jgi:hypothetical protein
VTNRSSFFHFSREFSLFWPELRNRATSPSVLPGSKF